MKFTIGLLLGLLIVPLGLYLYLAAGMAPVATTDSDMPFERYLAHKALDLRIAKELPKNSPIPPSEVGYLAGAELYKQHCAVCHGVPLAPKSSIAAGMYPQPPRLLEGKGVTDDPPGETYWKIANGIRLTGMPGFGKSLSETQMWEVALLLANADKLPAATKATLVAPMAPGMAPAMSAPPGVPPAPPSSPAPPK